MAQVDVLSINHAELAAAQLTNHQEKVVVQSINRMV
jgi:hypothetical protein